MVEQSSIDLQRTRSQSTKDMMCVPSLQLQNLYPSEKTKPRKINENNTNAIITIDFFAITTEDMKLIRDFDT